MTHDIKIHPQFFCRVKDGTKTFEVRENSRAYQPGDFVLLREWNPEIVEKSEEWGPSGETDYWQGPKGYTGQSITAKVGFVLPIDGGNVVFSLLDVKVEL